MRFSWKGLMLAPLLSPLIFSAASAGLFGSDRPALLFLILMVPGCLLSYGATTLVFLPSLFLLSRWTTPNAFSVCALGLALGAAMVLPLNLMLWKGSGPDSGPPVESFLVFVARFGIDPLMAIFPLAGLATAGLYWRIGTLRRGPDASRLAPAP